MLDEVLAGVDPHEYPRRFDLLIVDEVHTAAPSGRGRYAVDSLRTEAVQRLAPHFEHRLFLSATPHNGFTESFTALLEMLDPRRFARGVRPDPKTLADVMVRRLKSGLRKELRKPDGSPRFAERRVDVLDVVYDDATRAAHADLERFAALRKQRATSATAKTATEFVQSGADRHPDWHPDRSW